MEYRFRKIEKKEKMKDYEKLSELVHKLFSQFHDTIGGCAYDEKNNTLYLLKGIRGQPDINKLKRIIEEYELVKEVKIVEDIKPYKHLKWALHFGYPQK